MRGPAPSVLLERSEELGRAYAERRAVDRGHEFRWPSRVLKAVVGELRAMTDKRCSYCDGQHLGATEQAEVDHFKPKSRPAFYALVCAWDNLFLSCKACNDAKREQWSESLLRPDADDFTFERYFTYDTFSDRVEVNTAANESDQAKARYTIDVFAMNRDDARSARALVRRMIRKLDREDHSDLGYRFLHGIENDAAS